MRIIISSIVDINRVANNRIHQFMKYLSKNHDLMIVCPRDTWRDGQLDVSEYESSKIIADQNIEHRYLSNSSLPLSPIFQEIFSEGILALDSRLNYSDYDIHLDYNTLFLGLAVSRRVQKYGIPTVYDLADDLPAMIRESPQIPNAFGPLAEQVGRKVIERKIENAEKISYITEGLRQDMNVPRSKGAHIPNGVHTDSFTASADSIDIDNWNKEFNIGYVGVTREWVDLSSLIQAVAKVRDRGIDAGIIIVGDEGGTNEMKQEAKQLGIRKHCHFAGTVPYKSIPNYINLFDVGTIPFKSGDIAENSLPLKLFEYMACEIPVVSSTIPGVEDAAGDIVRFADTVDNWSEELLYLANHADSRRQLGSKGRMLVTESYSWNAITEQMEELLLESKAVNTKSPIN